MPESINPMALTPDTLAGLLKKCRCQGLADDTLERQIASGLPVNGDGTVNLIEYTAWLLKEVNGYGGESDPAQAD